jgi:ribonuclease HI
MSARFVLRTDGGARGNPGPAGAGFVLEDASRAVVRSGGRYLGQATNNQAEYEALILGLEVALDHKVRDLEVRADSELVVKQMSGHYRVKNAGLAPLHAEAARLAGLFQSVTFVHVRREENERADLLANAAMDAKHAVGDEAARPSSVPRLFD